MRLSTFAAVAAVTLTCASAARGTDSDVTVPTYHADAARSGHYVVPGLTWANAGEMRRDGRSTDVCRGTFMRSRSTGARRARRVDW